jgi:hypothetical protein
LSAVADNEKAPKNDQLTAALRLPDGPWLRHGSRRVPCGQKIKTSINMPENPNPKNQNNDQEFHRYTMPFNPSTRPQKTPF